MISHRVRDRFDGEAKNWNAHYRQPARQSIYAHNLLRRQANTKNLIDSMGGRMLELGCGAGNVLIAAAKQTRSKAFGADFSPGMLKQARNNARQAGCELPLLRSDACSLPFLSSSFNTVLCLGVIEYIPDYQKVIAECMRILKPEGQFIVSIPNKTSPFVRTDDLVFGIKNTITRGLLPAGIRAFIKTRLLGRPDKPYFNHKRQRFYPDAFHKELQTAGFHIQTKHYHTFGFGLLEGLGLNVRLSEYVEQRAIGNPKLEKLGWTCILKAIKP